MSATFMLIRRDRVAEVDTQTTIVGFPAIRDDTLTSQDARLLLFIQPPAGGAGTVAFTQNITANEVPWSGDAVCAFEPVA